VPTAGKQRADWFGRPARGDGEGVEAQAKPSSMEAASMTPAVTNRVRRSRRLVRDQDATVKANRPDACPDQDSFAAAKARGRWSERLGNERSIA